MGINLNGNLNLPISPKLKENKKTPDITFRGGWADVEKTEIKPALPKVDSQLLKYYLTPAPKKAPDPILSPEMKTKNNQLPEAVRPFANQCQEKYLKEFYEVCDTLKKQNPAMINEENTLALAKMSAKLKTDNTSLKNILNIDSGKWIEGVLLNKAYAVDDKVFALEANCIIPTLKYALKEKDGNLLFNTSKTGDVLAVLNNNVLVEPAAVGLYTQDTQFLNNYTASVLDDNKKPVEMDVTGYTNNDQLATFSMSNAKEQVGIERKQAVNKGLFLDELNVTNSSTKDKTFKIDLSSQVMDIFEVRNGVPKKKRDFKHTISPDGSIILNTVMDKNKDLGVKVSLQVNGKPLALNSINGSIIVNPDNTLSADIKLPGNSTQKVEVVIQPIVSLLNSTQSSAGQVLAAASLKDGSDNKVLNKPFINGVAVKESVAPTSINQVLAAASLVPNKIDPSFEIKGKGVFAKDATKIFNTALSDVELLENKLTVDGKELSYLAAGLPLYNCMFGRDSATSLIFLAPVKPKLVENVIQVLGSKQGLSLADRIKEEQKINPAKSEKDIEKMYKNRNEAEGKILHELRVGDLAEKREIDHCPHYGTVDATPLWLMSISEYHKWNGNPEKMKEWMPNIEKSLKWIDSNLDQDGFLKFIDPSGNLTNQGWKDSGNSAKHALGPDGKIMLPKYPIALAEVQGYVYEAKLGVAQIYKDLGQPEKAEKLEKDAAKIKESFNKKFWLPEEKFFAMALDADNKPIHSYSKDEKTGKESMSLTSNAGQALSTGIIDTTPNIDVNGKMMSKAGLVEQITMSPELNSGWGIKTLNKSAPAHNAKDYHNGTVWPHDTAFVARGLNTENAAQINKGLLEAVASFPGMHVPEVLAGFERKPEDKTVDIYPNTCVPQLWSSAGMVNMPFQFLGVKPDVKNSNIVLNNPSLPVGMDSIKIDNITFKNQLITVEAVRAENNELKITATNGKGEKYQVTKDKEGNIYRINTEAPVVAATAK